MHRDAARQVASILARGVQHGSSAARARWHAHLDIAEDKGLAPGYKLKLNLKTRRGIELHEALNRIPSDTRG